MTNDKGAARRDGVATGGGGVIWGLSCMETVSGISMSRTLQPATAKLRLQFVFDL